MGEIDHWHPVLRSRELGRAPVGVNVAGHEIAVFRTRDGLGALADRCAHRGMRLSLGKVERERLVCGYHGWKWAADGSGVCPASPRAKPCTRSYDVVERHDAIWVKSAGSVPRFPRLDVSGCFPFAQLRHRAPVPLDLALDNFIEVEHTPQVHAILGYPADRMHEVETRVTVGEESVHVHNVGPQRRLPAALYKLYGVSPDLLFVDEWTTWFSPVHTVYLQYWIDATTREQVLEAVRIAVFFNPVSPVETELFVLGYTEAAPWGRGGLNSLLMPLTRAFVELELKRDCKLLGSLADRSTSLSGDTLGRFDRALLVARSKVDRTYRGKPEGALRVVAEA